MAARQVQKRIWRDKSPSCNDTLMVRDVSQSPQATSSDSTFAARNQAEDEDARQDANGLRPTTAATAAAAAFRQMRSWMGPSKKVDEETEDGRRMRIDWHRLVNFDLEKVRSTGK